MRFAYCSQVGHIEKHRLAGEVGNLLISRATSSNYVTCNKFLFRLVNVVLVSFSEPAEQRWGDGERHCAALCTAGLCGSTWRWRLGYADCS